MQFPLRNKSFRFPVNTLVGSSYSNFIATTKKFRIDKKYRRKYFLTKQICRILDLFAKKGQKKTRKQLENFTIEHPPVFIIGFWRSGTTVLHNLFCQNPLFGYVTTFHSVFPNHILTNHRWLKSLMNPFLPETRPVDNLKFDIDYPQEEEIALGNMQPISFYNFFYFPDDTDKIINESLFFNNVPAGEMENWKKKYLQLIKAALINTRGKCFISKNPANTFRIKILLEMFPDARFVFIHRDIYQTLYSFREFVHAVDAGITLQEYDHDRLDREMIRLHKLLHDQYKQDKLKIPAGHLAEVDFKVFENNKLQEMEHIYKQLGLQGFENAMPAMKNYLMQISSFKRNDHLITDDFRKKVDDELRKLANKK